MEAGKFLFGAGCFWGVQASFDSLQGVLDTEVGYAGGHTDNPTYHQVCTGSTDHAEVCLVKFDTRVTSYSKLVEHFFAIHDPTTSNQQGPDVGTQYRSVVFYYDDDQKMIAQEKKQDLIDQGLSVVTEVSQYVNFWKAEEYHQHYLRNKSK